MMVTSFTFSQDGGIKKWIEKRKETKSERIAAGNSYLTPLVGPGYTPETGLLIAGGVLFTFKTNPKDSLIQRSSMPLTAFISTRGNIGLNGRLSSFWNEDRFRFNVVAKYSDADDDYFGVGSDAAESVSKGEETTLYHRNTFIFSPHFLVRLFPNMYMGLLWNINKSKVTETNPLMAEDEYYQKFGPDNFNSGLGFSLGYDSRDITVNAYKGFYGNITGTFFGGYLGSDNNYNVYEVDLRSYHQVERPGNIIALKLYGRFANGDVPYDELTRLGGGDALRGYVKGQYRDKAGVYFISEWRHMFLNREQEVGKHGIAVWLGSGSMASSIDQIKDWIPNLGVGYRLEVQPRMNLRIDFGLGKDSSGLYFNFSEAF